jgi:hypothetical protein
VERPLSIDAVAKDKTAKGEPVVAMGLEVSLWTPASSLETSTERKDGAVVMALRTNESSDTTATLSLSD